MDTKESTGKQSAEEVLASLEELRLKMYLSDLENQIEQEAENMRSADIYESVDKFFQGKS